MSQHYNKAYKREAVARAKASGNVSQTARELGISNKSLDGWIKAYGTPLDVNTASEKERAAQIQLSMSRADNCYDNAAAVSFFAT